MLNISSSSSHVFTPTVQHHGARLFSPFFVLFCLLGPFGHWFFSFLLLFQYSFLPVVFVAYTVLAHLQGVLRYTPASLSLSFTHLWRSCSISSPFVHSDLLFPIPGLGYFSCFIHCYTSTRRCLDPLYISLLCYHIAVLSEVQDSFLRANITNCLYTNTPLEGGMHTRKMHNLIPFFFKVHARANGPGPSSPICTRHNLHTHHTKVSSVH